MNSTPYSIKDFAPIPIDSIKIGSRFRKDLGDIASPAEDIGKIGLLHPIVINQKRELISGLRRIEAFKLLGKSEIPAHFVNLDDIVKGEISENTQRKDYSWEEIIQIKKAIEPEIKKESEKRMLSGKPSANFAEGSGSNNNKTTYKNYSENQTRAKVAKNVSLHGKKISHTTLAKAEKVYDGAQQEPATFSQIWTDLNSEKISPNGAYKKIQTHQNKIVESQSLAANKQNEFKGDKKKKGLVSIISVSFEALWKDMDAVLQRTKGTDNIFWKLSVNLATREAKIEFCGITQEKDVTMTSIGKG